jgi:hypothetical protein
MWIFPVMSEDSTLVEETCCLPVDECSPTQASLQSVDDDFGDLILDELREKVSQLGVLVSERDDHFVKNGHSGNVALSYRFDPKLISSGETIFENFFDLAAIIQTLEDITITTRSLWDSDFVSGEVIVPRKEVGGGEAVAQIWCAFKGRFGFPGRDFVWNQYHWINEDGTEAVSIATSVTVGDEPNGYKPGEKGNYVRGATAIGGYKFSIIPDVGTRVIFFNQTDIGSNLPGWITDSVLKKSPSKLEYLRKFMTQQ